MQIEYAHPMAENEITKAVLRVEILQYRYVLYPEN
jgi:hypothetical protein